jgi:hypothetical protein
MPRVPAPEPVAHLSWDQVLAFRLQRQFLEPRTAKNVVEVTRRLCGVQAQVTSAAAMAIAVRRPAPKAGELDRAIRARRVVKTWAMRGTLHVLPADDAAGVLASLSRLEPWRARAWERYHGVSAREVETVIAALREVLSDEPIGRDDLKSELASHIRSNAAREKIGSGWSELLKPAAWSGVLLQGPAGPGGQVTFVRADAWVQGWTTPDPDEAGVELVRRYLAAFGPGAPEHFAGWWARQQPGKVRRWFQLLGETIVPVDVEGTVLWALADDVSRLTRAQPSEAVRLLGNFDQWVLGPAAGSAAFIPAEHKGEVSRTAGWISKVVVLGGRVVGVWEIDEATGRVRSRLWEPVPERELAAEAARIEG